MFTQKQQYGQMGPLKLMLTYALGQKTMAFYGTDLEEEMVWEKNIWMVIVLWGWVYFENVLFAANEIQSHNVG